MEVLESDTVWLRWPALLSPEHRNQLSKGVVDARPFVQDTGLELPAASCAAALWKGLGQTLGTFES